MAIELATLLNDNRSGSTVLTQKAFSFYKEMIKTASGKNADLNKVYKALQDVSKTLIKKQPNMVLLRRTSNNLLVYFKRLINSSKEKAEIYEAVETKIDSIMEEVQANRAKIASMGAKIIAQSNKVMTISNSSLVREVLFTADAQKRRFEVYCLKSHPPDEGIDLAEQLATKGINAKLISDAAQGTFIPSMNLILIGTDRIFEGGFVNKSGTLPLCLTARHYNIPVYLVAETAKILRESERSVKFNDNDRGEVYPGKIKQLSVENIYYEKIPLELVHKVICEDGVFDTFEFENWYLKE